MSHERKVRLRNTGTQTSQPWKNLLLGSRSSLRCCCLLGRLLGRRLLGCGLFGGGGLLGRSRFLGSSSLLSGSLLLGCCLLGSCSLLLLGRCLLLGGGLGLGCLLRSFLGRLLGLGGNLVGSLGYQSELSLGRKGKAQSIIQYNDKRKRCNELEG